MEIVGKLTGADGTDPLHEPRAHIVAVDVDHVVDLLGVGEVGDQLKVDEGHMVREQDIGGLDALHVDLLQLVFLPRQHHLGQKLNEPGEVDGLADGIFGRFIGFLNAVIDRIIHVNLPFIL